MYLVAHRALRQDPGVDSGELELPYRAQRTVEEEQSVLLVEVGPRVRSKEQ